MEIMNDLLFFVTDVCRNPLPPILKIKALHLIEIVKKSIKFNLGIV